MTKKQKHQEENGLRRLDPDFVATFLSPIALAAHSTNYQSFTYHIAGYALRIGSDMNTELSKMCTQLESIYRDLKKQMYDLDLETNGQYAEFLSTPVKDINFSVRTYHGLYGSGDCRTMLDVAKLGKKGVAGLRLIGSKAIEEIRTAFIKAGCVELFDAEP